MNTLLNPTSLLALAWTGAGMLLTACAALGPAKKEDMTSVGIQSLNYSAREVASIGVDHPDKPGDGSGGDSLNPYEGGGTICCFSVPSKWRPDFKVVVEYQFYPEKEYRKAVVSVPPYPNGIAGDIWLIVHEDESVEAVVSNYEPWRDEWPGKVKGYPVPSREYRLKLWEEKVAQEKAYIANGLPRVNDPSYTKAEKERLEKNIEYSKALLNHLLNNKP